MYVLEGIVTQNKLLQIARKVKPEAEWKTSTANSSMLLQEALNAFAAGDSSQPVVKKLLLATALAGDRYGSAYDKTDNELLGIGIIKEDELGGLITQSLS